MKTIYLLIHVECCYEDSVRLVILFLLTVDVHLITCCIPSHSAPPLDLSTITLNTSIAHSLLLVDTPLFLLYFSSILLLFTNVHSTCILTLYSSPVVCTFESHQYSWLVIIISVHSHSRNH